MKETLYINDKSHIWILRNRTFKVERNGVDLNLNTLRKAIYALCNSLGNDLIEGYAKGELYNRELDVLLHTDYIKLEEHNYAKKENNWVEATFVRVKDESWTSFNSQFSIIAACVNPRYYTVGEIVG